MYTIVSFGGTIVVIGTSIERRVCLYLQHQGRRSLELDSLSIAAEEEENPEDSLGLSGGLGTVTTMSGPSTQYCYGTTSTTRWYHLSFGKVLYETVPGTLAQKTHYIYAGDERIAEIDYNGVVYYYINDHLGTSRVMVRGYDGAVAAKYYRYGAYGKTMSEMVNIVNQPNKYTSKPYDDDLGVNLYYFGARYYDPRTGRWPAVDPMRGKYPGWSPYVYAMDNPFKYYDSDGNEVSMPTYRQLGEGAWNATIAEANKQIESAKNTAVSIATNLEKPAAWGALASYGVAMVAAGTGNLPVAGAATKLGNYLTLTQVTSKAIATVQDPVSNPPSELLKTAAIAALVAGAVSSVLPVSQQTTPQSNQAKSIVNPYELIKPVD